MGATKGDENPVDEMGATKGSNQGSKEILFEPTVLRGGIDANHPLYTAYTMAVPWSVWVLDATNHNRLRCYFYQHNRGF